MSWLGIAILILFSLGLSWFMRFERSLPRRLPEEVGHWQRDDHRGGDADGTYGEKRLWFYEGGWWRPHRLVEQARIRDQSDGRIVRTLPERLVDQWRGRVEP
jgi:hypothetical protein